MRTPSVDRLICEFPRQIYFSFAKAENTSETFPRENCLTNVYYVYATDEKPWTTDACSSVDFVWSH